MNIFNDLRSYSRHWIKEFIETYKSEVCLWQTKHPDYNNHILRNQAYEKLIGKLKEVESNPDRSMVVRKINSLRSAFRREYRKKCERRSYEPRLWYYDMLSFIADEQYNQTKRKASLKKPLKTECFSVDFDESETSQYEEVFEEDLELKNTKNVKVLEVTIPDHETQQAVNNIEEQPQTQNLQVVNTQSLQTHKDYTDTPTDKEHQMKTVSVYKPDYIPYINSSGFKHEDEFDAIGINVASKLRGMNQTQRIIAEKLISDVLFSGQLDNLTVTSKLSL